MVDDKEVGVRQMPTVQLELILASRLDDTYQGTGDDCKYPSYFGAVIEEATKTVMA